MESGKSVKNRSDYVLCAKETWTCHEDVHLNKHFFDEKDPLCTTIYYKYILIFM